MVKPMATSDTQRDQTATSVSEEAEFSAPNASEGKSSLKFQILERTLPLIGISMFFAVLVTYLAIRTEHTNIALIGVIAFGVMSLALLAVFSWFIALLMIDILARLRSSKRG